MSLTDEEKLKGYVQWVKLQPPLVKAARNIYREKDQRRLISAGDIRKYELACVDDEKRMREKFGWILKELYGWNNPCFHFKSTRRGILGKWFDHGHHKCPRVQGEVKEWKKCRNR